MKVTRKTDATSISSAEYKRIKKGMTLAQVRKIIGGKGQYQDGSLSMDALKFEWTTGVTFTKGRVTDKWTFENSYDWC